MSAVSSLPTGLAVPAVRIPGGIFAVRNPYDTAFGDILLAILVPTGTRPMDRGFGSRLNTLLFGPKTSAANGTAKYIITEAISRLCPTVNLIGVETAITLEGFALEVTFSLVGDPSAQTRSAFLQKSDLLRLVYDPNN